MESIPTRKLRSTVKWETRKALAEAKAAALAQPAPPSVRRRVEAGVFKYSASHPAEVKPPRSSPAGTGRNSATSRSGHVLVSLHEELAMPRRFPAAALAVLLT